MVQDLIFFNRDLAARNCLVDKNGRVKVADFGLSRCLEDNKEYFTQTKEFPVRWWAVEVLCNGLLNNFIFVLNKLITRTIYNSIRCLVLWYNNMGNIF